MAESGAAVEAAQRTMRDTDLWRPVATTGLPVGLLEAVEAADWERTKDELASVFDSLNTDGVYGRALHQVARQLPLGVYPAFDQYRAAVAIDYGDWDDLRRCMAANPVALAELQMARGIFLGSVNEMRGRPTTSPMENPFLAYELQLSGRAGWYRQWAKRLPSYDARPRWERVDVPTGRHFRVRLLHHTALLAATEAQAGSLDRAAALGREALRLGDEGEPLRDIAQDVTSVAGIAMGGERSSADLKLFSRTPTPRGLSPLGTFEWIYHVVPFLDLYQDDRLGSAADLMHRIAARLGSPKALLLAESWRVAAQVLGAGTVRTDLSGLLSAARAADVGLRVLPELLHAITTKRYSALQEAERVARSVGAVWAQVSALTWIAALDPAPQTSRRLCRLLLATGWRRPVGVPDSVLSDAATGMLATGVRNQALVELAMATGRAVTAAEVAAAHATDESLETNVRLASLEALSRLSTAHSRRLLERAARGGDDISQAAKRALTGSAQRLGLSEREVEVLNLVGRGLTNRAIGEKLYLSQHTVARHLANAREKLGALNRADAAVRLGLNGLDVSEPVDENRSPQRDSVGSVSERRR